MFPLLIEKIPSEEFVVEEEEVENEPEEKQDEYTESVTQEITQCFDLFDKTQTGRFELKYLEKALKCLGINLSAYEMEEVTELLDNNGVVLFEPFYAFAFDKLMAVDPTEALKNAFQTFDPENEGVIPSDNLKRWVTTLGEPLTEKEAKELIKLGDPVKKGFIAYEDLVYRLMAYINEK